MASSTISSKTKNRLLTKTIKIIHSYKPGRIQNTVYDLLIHYSAVTRIRVTVSLRLDQKT